MYQHNPQKLKSKENRDWKTAEQTVQGLWDNKKRSLFSCSVMSDSVTPWTATRQASLFFTISRSLLKLMSIESVMPSIISSSIIPFSSCLQSFPASKSFLMSQLFTSDSQSIGASASASVLPMNILGWFPLGLTRLISLQYSGLSRVISNTTVQTHQLYKRCNICMMGLPEIGCTCIFC